MIKGVMMKISTNRVRFLKVILSLGILAGLSACQDEQRSPVVPDAKPQALEVNQQDDF